MDYFGHLRSRLQDYLVGVLSLPSSPAEDEMHSCLSHDISEPLATAASENSVSVEEAYQFTVRNLSTGETLDLRDENSPDFASRYAHLLCRADKEGLEHFL